MPMARRLRLPEGRVLGDGDVEERRARADAVSLPDPPESCDGLSVAIWY